MHTSTERVLTTHVGSLPRPEDVVDFLLAQDRGDPLDEAQFDASLQRAVGEVVGRQAEAGIDIASDGEMSKISCGQDPGAGRDRLELQLRRAPRAGGAADS